MIKKIPLVLCALLLTTSLFAQEKIKKSCWYTSIEAKGYINIQRIDSTGVKGTSSILKTNVNATFDSDALNFSLSTINDTPKMISPSKIIFDGSIDTNIKPVHFTGTRIKKDKKNISFWSFDGDFSDEMETDPDFQSFAFAKYSATLKIPNRTIPSFNVWAIVPNLPFDRKGTFIFNSLDETKLYVRKNRTINYLGKYKATIHGKEMLLHKFVLQGKKTEPTYFWVNDKRELVQILLDNKYTFTKNTEKAALSIITVANK